ncbi:cilia- and flagella-associated protein 410-like isoform X2 [Phymastichus coffea]|uniref:cilia- and flagella-associated protein 410-like isoform X2 n=1 Tax=Phymastichus coffea TaxID=108790 RepID=UPI00273C2796|nr:cilia- and flagella-associated protein 410-like isoform X2 [Phymastichus coffea]
MVRLTEEMVAARTRVSDCSAVKKLNCWGTELTDVSILRKMTNVEVLSLSVNNINSLADFQNCLNLKDLFVRRNKIRDLNEVCFLQRLPNLRNLWLGENPCADVEGYRLAVIKALPNLEKLDEKIVTPEEVQTAMLRGKALVHPLSTMQEEPLSPQSGHGSPEVVMAKYSEEQDMDERRNYSSSDDQRSYDEPPSVDDYQETDKRNANYNTSPVHQYSSNNRYSYEDCNERTAIPRHNGDYENQRIYTPVSPRTQYPQAEYIDERRIEYEEPQRPQSSQSKRGMMNQSMERDDFNQSTSWARRGEDKRRSQFQYQRRPVTRNSNILSAVLCLVKELDYPSLEVVEMAVRSRIEELEE